MTIVVGQIEPLKKLKTILRDNGITRFRSIGEINVFARKFDSEKKEISKFIENKTDEEIDNLQSDLIRRQQIYKDLKASILNELNQKVINLDKTIKHAIEKRKINLFNKIIYFIKIRMLTNNKISIENNLENIARKKSLISENEVIKSKNTLDEFRENRNKIILTRCAKSYEELDFTKVVVDGLYPLIAGAIGENSVVNEIQKLSDEYFLINDFSVNFDPPIYNKREDDRIFSIQIDHLLVSQSGVFLLETKNWSKQSINNLNLRSPVEQILRTSYALFILLNSESKFNQIDLVRHHWGSKKIPIRNIVVMTNEKHKEEFKHVKVLSLNELNGYIKYFDNIFNSSEVKNIFNHLNNKNAS